MRRVRQGSCERRWGSSSGSSGSAQTSSVLTDVEPRLRERLPRQRCITTRSTPAGDGGRKDTQRTAPRGLNQRVAILRRLRGPAEEGDVEDVIATRDRPVPAVVMRKIGDREVQPVGRIDLARHSGTDHCLSTG